jgi:hypothetical protein
MKKNFLYPILIMVILTSCSFLESWERAPSSFIPCKQEVKQVLLGRKKAEQRLYYQGAFFKHEKMTDTWGVETELFRPLKVSDEKILNKLKSFFKKKKYKNIKLNDEESADEESFDYFIRYERNDKVETWGLPYEPDLYDRHTGQTVGIELTTPVMRNDDDLILFVEVLQLMEKLKLSSAIDRGGVHVHIGTQSLTIEELYLVAKALESSYDQLIKFFKPQEKRKHIQIGQLRIGLPRLLKLVKEKSSILASEAKLVHNYFKYGPFRFNEDFETLEFRFFNSTTNPTLISFYKEFSIRFVRQALSDSRFRQSVETMSYAEIFRALRFDSWPVVPD